VKVLLLGNNELLACINVFVVIFAVLAEGIILYAVVREVRKGNDALACVERITLATLGRIAPQQGSPS
jgi:hypothetical protein